MVKQVKMNQRKQLGFISTEVAIAGLVISALAISTAVLTRNESLDELAYATGKNAGQVNSAIRSYISKNGSDTPEGTYNGISWLKSASECGGSATGTESYLPCNFPEELALGLYYQIDITNTAGKVESVMEIGIPHNSAEYVPYLSGEVVSGARGTDIMSIAPGVGNTYFTVHDNEDGFITLTASNDPGNDLYMRADGSVKPTGDFNWNNATIVNVDGLHLKNFVASQSGRAPTFYTDKIYPADSSSTDNKSNNPRKQIDLLGNTVLTDVEMDRTILRDYQQVGADCVNQGQIAIDIDTGKILTCSVDYKWESQSNEGFDLYEASSDSNGGVKVLPLTIAPEKSGEAMIIAKGHYTGVAQFDYYMKLRMNGVQIINDFLPKMEYALNFAKPFHTLGMVYLQEGHIYDFELEITGPGFGNMIHPTLFIFQ